MDIVQPIGFNRGVVLYIIGETLDPAAVTRVVGVEPDAAKPPRRELTRTSDGSSKDYLWPGFWARTVRGEPTHPIDADVGRAIEWITMHHDALKRMCSECRFVLLFPYPGPQPSDLVMDYREAMDHLGVELKSLAV